MENYQNPKAVLRFQGHKYTGPYNDLDSQLRYDSNTGKILQIFDPPSGKTDAVAMQHDVDYSICGDNKKCKNAADRKMVKALDNIPWKERQWGHWLARNAINTKQTTRSWCVKKRKTALSGDWAQQLAEELHKPITRKFTKRRVFVEGC